VLAVNTALQTNNQDAIIKAANDLLTQFADTDYKEWAFKVEAKAYQTKGDAEHAQAFGQQALQLDPKDYTMMLLLGEVIGTHIGDHDLDRQDKITSAAKYLNDSIETVNAAPKPNPQVTDDQWAEYKKYTVAEAHNGLGMVDMAQKNWDGAITEFKTAVEGDPQDAYNTRLASVYLSAGKYDESIAICDKLLANASLHPTIKGVVTNIKNSAVAAKNRK
jgi:tetratricopeptide (TPR) repeat protein